MRLQKLQFPKENNKDTKTLYIRSNQENFADCEHKKDILFTKRNMTLEFNTYFNSFSLEKWMRYTNLSNLRFRLTAKGKFTLTFYRAIEVDGRIQSVELSKNEYDLDKKCEIVMKLPIHSVEGILYPVIDTESDVEIYEGEYESVCEIDIEKQVHLGIVICTYKREEYIKNTLEQVKKMYLQSDENLDKLKEGLFIYIVDNGKTLSEYVKPYEKELPVCLLPNANVGGAGGFTRGLIELLREEKDKKLTHVLFMDDDAIIAEGAIEKTFSFLSIIKEKYQEYSIGGGLLRKDLPCIQYESGAIWDKGNLRPLKAGYDLTDFHKVIINEKEEDVEYNGWWYCCIPLSKVHEKGLPLPFFIHRDDIEYGLRASEHFITLNGINVWHESFENKHSQVLEYYELRNQGITNAIHYKDYSAKEYQKAFLRYCIKNLNRYQYQYIDLNINGVQDFLKGVDYFMQINGEKYHQNIINRCYKLDYMDELEKQLGNKRIHHLKGYHYQCDVKHSLSKRKMIQSRITFNGMLLFHRKNQVGILQSNMPIATCYGKSVLVHMDATNRGYITRFQLRKLVEYLCKITKTYHMIGLKYQTVASEYRNRVDDYSKVEFWKRYLQLM